MDAKITSYKRNCPECGKILYYSSKDSLSHCKNNKCIYCSNVIRGKTSNRKGCHHTAETKLLMSKAKLGVKRTEISRKKQSESRKTICSNLEWKERLSKKIKEAMHRPDVRKKHIQLLSETKYLGKSTDIGQIQLLEKWNGLGFRFEPNYQVKTGRNLFYIDGYDKEKNVVLEYDSKYHTRSGQQQKDLVRQQKIIDILHPKRFWRYDAVNKQFRNII